MGRLDDWQIRFRATIAQWIDKEFVWGQTDCFCFAAACIEAMTGQNPMNSVLANYKSKQGAFRAIAAGVKSQDGKVYKADGLDGYLRLFLGREKPVSMAQRGDIVLCDVNGNDCTGVMSEDGKRVWVMCSPAGMALVPIQAGVKAWAV